VTDARPAGTIPARPQRSTTRFRFGAFEVDTRQRELRKRGLRIRLPEQPFKILEILLASRGRLVTRMELANALWPSLHVSFDQSLNTAVNALRQALGDSSKSCRFIETRPGLGYCFVAYVEEIGELSVTDVSAAQSMVSYIPEAAEPSAHGQDYQKGRHFYERFTEAALLQSVAYFESVIQGDDHHALACAGLSDAYASLAALNVLPPGEAHAKSHPLVSQALEWSADSAETQICAGIHLRTFHRDWAAAKSSLERAVQLNPKSAAAHREWALTRAAQGAFEEALESARRALDLGPVSLANNCALSWILYVGGWAQRAYEQAWKTLALDVSMPLAQYMLALSCQELGLIDEAIAELENARLGWCGNPAATAALAHVYAAAGMEEHARKLTGELQSLAEARYVSPYWLAIAYAAANPERAIEALGRSFEEGDVCLVWLDVDPRFKSLRSSGRFISCVHPPGR
jgi:DNA-binding winged helix-turn-helix (wHTH) protein